MPKKYCKNCNMVLNQDVKFCPECGGAVVKFKDKKEAFDIAKSLFNKKVIIIGSIILGLVVIGIVSFAVIQAFVLDKNAQNAKNNVANKAKVEYLSDSIGNLPCNLACGAYSVAVDDKLYYAANDGIYESKELNNDLINLDNSRKLTEGKYCCLNYYEENLYAINTSENSIYKLSDLNNDDKKPYADKIYASEEGVTLVNFGINSDNVYILSNASGVYHITSTNLRNKSKVNNVFEGLGTKAWFYLSESTLRLCIADASGWVAYKGEIDGNKTSGINKYCSGSGAPLSVGFSEDKVYTLFAGTSGKSTIMVSDEAGNSRDISLENKVVKILLSGESVFLQIDNNNFAWFNTDTNMTHDINSDNFKDEKVRTVNINNGRFCVLYSDDSIVTIDINSLN